jgi:hypothetical protein
MTENRINQWALAAASFFIPGFGHVYMGRTWQKGAVFFIGRFVGFVLFLLYAIMYSWAIGSSAYLADILPPTHYFFFVYSMLVFIPWIFVALYDALIVFSMAGRMNAGEIPVRENKSWTTWIYAVIILLLTFGFTFISYFFFFLMA